MKKKHLVIVGLLVFCCLSWSINSVAAVAAQVKCDSWGCTVDGAITEAALAQVKKEGKLSESALTLKNVTNDDLKKLPTLKAELTQLVIQDSKAVTDITPLGELTGLKSLELYLDNPADFSPVAKLVNLAKLRITKGKYTSFDFLKPLSGLETLMLDSPPQEPSAISALAGKTKLKTLTFGGANIKDISPLKDAINLEFLSLYATKVTDLAPLTALKKNLKKLNLVRIPAKDLTPVGELSELAEIYIEATDFADYAPLARCTKVKMLEALASNFDKLEVIATMPDLSSLNLLKSSKVQQWDALKTAKNLDFLQVTETSFSDLTLVAHMDKLRYLYISKTAVIHPEAISALPNLGTLGIVETQGISDVSMFKTLPKLETLYIKKGQFPQTQLDALKAANPKLRISEY